MTTVLSFLLEAIQGSAALEGLIMVELAMIIFRSGILTICTFVSGTADLISGKQIESWKIQWFLRHSILSGICIYITKQLMEMI